VIDLESETTVIDGVAFVAVTVTNARRTAQRVAVRSLLSEPPLVPRECDGTAPAWEGTVWRGQVAAGRTRGIGFAALLEDGQMGSDRSIGEPVELVSAERATGNQRADVVSSLPPWAPNRVAIGSREHPGER